MPAGLLAALERRYALGPIDRVERLTGGYANDVYWEEQRENLRAAETLR